MHQNRARDRFGQDSLAAGIKQLHFNMVAGRNSPKRSDFISMVGQARLVIKIDFSLDFQHSVMIIGIEFGPGKKVEDMHLGGGIQINVTVDTGHPPVVLIFQVAAVGPADDHNRHCVLAGLDIGR